MRGIHDEYFERFNYENYGGTPVLGIKGNVIIGHGISNEKAVKNMLLHARDVAQSGLSQRINEAFN
jgi:glycerol-3-phosphate acyltransferase PlsX